MSEARLFYNYAVDSLPNKNDRDAIRKYVDELEQRLESQCERRRLCPGLDAYIPVEDCEGCDNDSKSECEKDNPILQCYERTKITELEQQNRELVEFIKELKSFIQRKIDSKEITGRASEGFYIGLLFNNIDKFFEQHHANEEGEG